MWWYPLMADLGFMRSGDFVVESCLELWSRIHYQDRLWATLVKTSDHLEQILKISSSDIDLYKICQNECLEKTLRCVESCISDDQCKSKCFREEIDCLDNGFIFMYVFDRTYDESSSMSHKLWVRDKWKPIQDSCPCGDNCIDGCENCSNKICKKVLVLSTSYPNNLPFTVRFDGKTNYNLNFKFGDETVAYRSCAATLNGEFWIFGGPKRQVRDFRYSVT